MTKDELLARRVRQFIGWRLRDQYVWLIAGALSMQPIIGPGIAYPDEDTPDSGKQVLVLLSHKNWAHSLSGPLLNPYPLLAGSLFGPRLTRNEVLATLDTYAAWLSKLLGRKEKKAAAWVQEAIAAQRPLIEQMPWDETPHPGFFALGEPETGEGLDFGGSWSILHRGAGRAARPVVTVVAGPFAMRASAEAFLPRLRAYLSASSEPQHQRWLTDLAVDGSIPEPRGLISKGRVLVWEKEAGGMQPVHPAPLSPPCCGACAAGRPCEGKKPPRLSAEQAAALRIAIVPKGPSGKKWDALRSGATDEEVAAVLREVLTERMGMHVDRDVTVVWSDGGVDLGKNNNKVLFRSGNAAGPWVRITLPQGEVLLRGAELVAAAREALVLPAKGGGAPPSPPAGPSPLSAEPTTPPAAPAGPPLPAELPPDVAPVASPHPLLRPPLFPAGDAWIVERPDEIRVVLPGLTTERRQRVHRTVQEMLQRQPPPRTSVFRTPVESYRLADGSPVLQAALLKPVRTPNSLDDPVRVAIESLKAKGHLVLVVSRPEPAPDEGEPPPEGGVGRYRAGDRVVVTAAPWRGRQGTVLFRCSEKHCTVRLDLAPRERKPKTDWVKPEELEVADASLLGVTPAQFLRNAEQLLRQEAAVPEQTLREIERELRRLGLSAEEDPPLYEDGRPPLKYLLGQFWRALRAKPHPDFSVGFINRWFVESAEGLAAVLAERQRQLGAIELPAPRPTVEVTSKRGVAVYQIPEGLEVSGDQVRCLRCGAWADLEAYEAGKSRYRLRHERGCENSDVDLLPRKVLPPPSAPPLSSPPVSPTTSVSPPPSASPLAVPLHLRPGVEQALALLPPLRGDAALQAEGVRRGFVLSLPFSARVPLVLLVAPLTEGDPVDAAWWLTDPTLLERRFLALPRPLSQDEREARVGLWPAWIAELPADVRQEVRLLAAGWPVAEAPAALRSRVEAWLKEQDPALAAERRDAEATWGAALAGDRAPPKLLRALSIAAERHGHSADELLGKSPKDASFDEVLAAVRAWGPSEAR